jgi:HK97 gp10 family phage protein
MSNAITINATELKNFTNTVFKGLEKELHDGLEGILFKNAQALVLQAKQRAPTDLGQLKNSISAPVNTADLEFTVSVNAFYAAYVEFGTGRYASAYVASLPQDWASYAAQFRGKAGNEGFDKFVDRMRDWCRRHGIPETAAYPICIKILRNGHKAQPFIYPSFEYVKPFIIKDIDTLLKRLSAK